MINDIFFYISKLIWNAIRPDNLLVLAIVIALWRTSKIPTSLWRICYQGLAFFLLVLTFVPLGNLMLIPLEEQFLANNNELLQNLDGIIVLSGGVTFDKITRQVRINENAARDMEFVRLARLYPNAKLIYSGGSSSLTNQEFKGADAGLVLLENLGLDITRVIFERDSRNTKESASELIKIVRPRDNENWILITSAYHMHRSLGVFCANGWLINPHPVDFKAPQSFVFNIGFSENLENFVLAFKEWIGLFIYRLTENTRSIFSNGCIQKTR